MPNRLILTITVRLTLAVARQVRRLRERPDEGMETADKILWAAAVTILASVVGAIFRDKLESFANGLTLTLGW